MIQAVLGAVRNLESVDPNLPEADISLPLPDFFPRVLRAVEFVGLSLLAGAVFPERGGASDRGHLDPFFQNQAQKLLVEPPDRGNPISDTDLADCISRLHAKKCTTREAASRELRGNIDFTPAQLGILARELFSGWPEAQSRLETFFGEQPPALFWRAVSELLKDEKLVLSFTDNQKSKLRYFMSSDLTARVEELFASQPGSNFADYAEMSAETFVEGIAQKPQFDLGTLRAMVDALERVEAQAHRFRERLYPFVQIEAVPSSYCGMEGGLPTILHVYALALSRNDGVTVELSEKYIDSLLRYVTAMKEEGHEITHIAQTAKERGFIVDDLLYSHKRFRADPKMLDAVLDYLEIVDNELPDEIWEGIASTSTTSFEKAVGRFRALSVGEDLLKAKVDLHSPLTTRFHKLLTDAYAAEDGMTAYRATDYIRCTSAVPVDVNSLEDPQIRALVDRAIQHCTAECSISSHEHSQSLMKVVLEASALGICIDDELFPESSYQNQVAFDEGPQTSNSKFELQRLESFGRLLARLRSLNLDCSLPNVEKLVVYARDAVKTGTTHQFKELDDLGVQLTMTHNCIRKQYGMVETKRELDREIVEFLNNQSAPMRDFIPIP